MLNSRPWWQLNHYISIQLWRLLSNNTNKWMWPRMCINTSKYGPFWSWDWGRGKWDWYLQRSVAGGREDRDERQLILWNTEREEQQEGDDISAQYKKTSNIEVIHIHKHTEDSLQLTELISGGKVRNSFRKSLFPLQTALKISLH